MVLTWVVVSDDPWASAEALQTAMKALQGLLLSLEPPQREAFRRHWLSRGGTRDDVLRARELLMRILAAMQTGDPRLWAELALAHAALSPAAPPTPSPDTVMTPDARDFTLPAVTEFRLALDLDEAAPGSEDPLSSTVDETVALGVLSVPHLGVADAPAPQTGTLKAGSSPHPVLDLEKYAVLCAWTELHPQRRADLHRQYGLADEAARTQLDLQFAARFRQDPSLRAAFDNRLKMHRKFLAATQK